MNWLEDIYQVVRAAYLGNGEDGQPSASWLPPTLPPNALNIPRLEPVPEDSYVGEWLKGAEGPERDLSGGSTGAKLARLHKLWTLDRPYALGKQIERFMAGDPTLAAHEVTELAALGVLGGAPGGGAGPVNMMRGQIKKNLGKMAAPMKQGKVRLLKETKNEALRAQIKSGNYADLYDMSDGPNYRLLSERFAGIEENLWSDVKRMETKLGEFVSGIRGTSKVLDEIPQATLDKIDKFDLSPTPFISTATQKEIGLAAFHFDKDLPQVAAHEIIHSGERSAAIGIKPNPEDMEMFKQLRALDLKTRVIDEYLNKPAFEDWTSTNPSELLIEGKIPTQYVQSLTNGPGYRNNPMELHANLMGKGLAEGKVTKENFAAAFLGTMKAALNAVGPDTEKMFELMAEREPHMRDSLAFKEALASTDYSYMIKHDDPEIAKSIQAITRQVSQGKGLFGDMVWFRGETNYVETRKGPEGTTQFKQYGEMWREGNPTLYEVNPHGNRIGEPVGISVSGDPGIATKMREQRVYRTNKLPHMKTPQIKALLDRYDRDIETTTEPYKADVLRIEKKFYEEEYARRTDPRSISRVKLNLEGDPDKTLVKAFTEKGKEALKTTYTEAMVEELAKVYKADKKYALEAVNLLEEQYTQGELFNEVEKTIKLNVSGAEKFNLNQTAKLQELGYKGIAYSPSRYDEYEVRIFEPEDVYAKDVRKWSRTDPSKSDPAIKRLMNTSQQDRLDMWEGEALVDEEEDRWGGGSLRNIYKQVDLRDVIYRAIKRAYGQETF